MAQPAKISVEQERSDALAVDAYYRLEFDSGVLTAARVLELPSNSDAALVEVCSQRAAELLRRLPPYSPTLNLNALAMGIVAGLREPQKGKR